MLLPENQELIRKTCEELSERVSAYRAAQMEQVRHCFVLHDDDTNRELELTKRRLSHLMTVLANCEIVHLAEETSVAAIGTIVTLQRYDKHGDPCPNVENYLIGDYGSSDPSQVIPVISHDSILIAGLLGRAVGDVVTVRLKTGTEIELELLDIRLPHGPVRLRFAA